MAIHEEHLIRPENIRTHNDLVIDGIDVSGHWSTFIETRVINDYNESLQEEIASLPGGEYIHRCWQCGSCTNSCTVNAINPDFNPRYWIYLIRNGMEGELLRDKDIIWQCVSCNRCTYACPRDVVPEAVMKATAHWLELKGHTEKSNSTKFDEVFSDQVIARGKIEETQTLMGFFKRTGQNFNQDWFIQQVKNLITNMPVKLLMSMGLSMFIKPRTKNWSKARDAINEYVNEKHAEHKKSLGLDDLVKMAEAEVTANK